MPHAALLDITDCQEAYAYNVASDHFGLDLT